jgi:hypothetical protein
MGKGIRFNRTSINPDAVKNLRADIEVAAGEASIVTTRVIIIKSLKSLPDSF